MSRQKRYGTYFEYTTADEVRMRAETSQRKMAVKKIAAEPVVVKGRTLTRTWWGQAWVQNLERYADFANRLGRGRSYVRAGAVIDLKIQPGQILAKVQGSRVRPYSVEITINSLPEARAHELAAACSARLSSLECLMDGSFPKDLAELFLVSEKGLFPSPREIHMNCSCPDWAMMCKHIAAVLYGTGVRLDEQPERFFTLRQIEMNQFVSQAIQSHATAILQQHTAIPDRERIMDMDSASLQDVFNLDPDDMKVSTTPSVHTLPDTPNKPMAPTAPDSPESASVETIPPKRRRGRPRKQKA